MKKPKTYKNDLPEVWLDDVKRIPDKRKPSRIHQGAPPRVVPHTTELLGFRDSFGYRLPSEVEAERWYANAPYPYNQLYCHEDLNSKAYVAEGNTQKMKSDKKVRDGFTAHTQRRAITQMGESMRGASRTGGFACNYGSPITIQIAINGCAADATKWTDQFFEDFAHVVAKNYQKIRDEFPEYADIKCLPYQTKPGGPGAWGSGTSRLKGGTGKNTGRFRMTPQEWVTGIRADGAEWNFAGHLHALPNNTHWDPSPYFPWVSFSDRVNEILGSAKPVVAKNAPIVLPDSKVDRLDVAYKAINTAKYQLDAYRKESA